MPLPKKNVAFTFSISLVDSANRPQFKANPTLASGDFKVSIDDGAFNNLASLPTVSPASGRNVVIALSASEMNGDRIVVQCVDAAGSEWDEVMVTILTSTRVLEDLAYPATSGRSIVVDASGLVDANAVKLGPSGSGTAQTAKDLGAINVTNLNTLSGHDPGETIMGATDLDAALTAIDDYVDTEVAAIKAKTDNLPASPAATSDCITAAGVRSAVGLASANLDTQLDALPTLAEILAGGDVDGYTLEQTLKLCLAALAGKLSGASGTTITIRAADDSKARITATVDGDGNRSAVTLDATG